MKNKNIDKETTALSVRRVCELCEEHIAAGILHKKYICRECWQKIKNREIKVTW